MDIKFRSRVDDLRVHVIKIMTGRDPWILYSHFSDRDHNPTITAAVCDGGEYDGNLYLRIADICKLKPNFQNRQLLRLDVYVPTTTAQALEKFIATNLGHAEALGHAAANPGDYVTGAGILPKMGQSFQACAALVLAEGSQFRALGESSRVFLDEESPAEGHVEMQGSELHIGVPDLKQISSVAQGAATQTEVPSTELKRDQANPVYKAQGDIHLVFNSEQSMRIAATLAHMFPKN